MHARTEQNKAVNSLKDRINLANCDLIKTWNLPEQRLSGLVGDNGQCGGV
jgi:hypothetical protein